jgi:hypothetical protein
MKGYQRYNPDPPSMSRRLTSLPTDGGGAQARQGAMEGLAGAPHLSSPGHIDAGFLGQNDAGVDGVLTQGETRWGMTPRWLTMVASLLRARARASDGSGTLPAPLSSSTPSSWPPLASRLVQWLQSTTFISNLVVARVRRV